MNKFLKITGLFLLILTITLGLVYWKGEYYSDARIAQIEDTQPVPSSSAITYDTLYPNKNRSEIAWKGTKMWGRGLHTGTVPIKSGYLLFKRDSLIGGSITTDMTSIGITDIPPDQPEAIRILTGHLEDELFFEVKRYPEAKFTITGVEYFSERRINISGNLKIKGVTKNIKIPADIDQTGHCFETTFRINRFNWNVAYRGGYGATRFAARNFVDKYIELKIKIVTNNE